MQVSGVSRPQLASREGEGIALMVPTAAKRVRSLDRLLTLAQDSHQGPPQGPRPENHCHPRKVCSFTKRGKGKTERWAVMKAAVLTCFLKGRMGALRTRPVPGRRPSGHPAEGRVKNKASILG